MSTHEIHSQKRSDGSEEILNIRLLQEISETTFKRDFQNWIEDEKTTDEPEKYRDDRDAPHKSKQSQGRERTQFLSFQKAMRVLFTFGQFLGLNPVTGILEDDISKMRFTLCSWKCLFSAFVTIFQTIALCSCMYRLVITSVSMKFIVFVCFYLSTWSTNIAFIRIATKWRILVKEIFNCNLDEYVDSSVITRCTVTFIVLILLALVEHLLFLTSSVSLIINCTTGKYDLYEEYARNMFSWLFDFGVPFNIPLALLLQFNLTVTTATWSYLDAYIICMSLYLTSVLNEINKKILWAVEKSYLPPSTWGTLREDYTRATRLVRLFDNMFSGLILISFTTNLLFTCVQLYFVLEHGTQSRIISVEKCPSLATNWPFYGYEHSIYHIFSLTFLIVRFLGVSLVAANVNVASMVPTTALYRLPSYSYTMEVQRFLEQVHDDVVALGGLEYFYITRELVLSVAGTILTYELVLLQLKTVD